MYNDPSQGKQFERLDSKNRGGFSYENDPGRKTMFSRFMIGLRSIAALELNDDVRELMASRVREQLEKTADQKQAPEAQPAPKFVATPEVPELKSIDELTQRATDLAESAGSRASYLPPEFRSANAVIGAFNQDLSNGA